MLDAPVLTLDNILLFIILGVTILLFISEVVRVDVVAILVVVLLGIAQILPPEQLFLGFSSEAVISLISIMIISGGIEKSGFTSRLAKWILKFSREHNNLISIMLMGISGLLASFMRSFGTVALFLPVVTRITARTGIPKSKLLMPLGFCAILGGTMTMVGSGPLILLNSLLNNINLYVQNDNINIEPFNLFDVLPIGFMLLTSGMFYLYISQRFLPEVKQKYRTGTAKSQFLKTYGKGGDVFELKVSKNSPLVGLDLQKVENKLDPLLSVVAIKKDKDTHFPPLRKTIIKVGDLLAIMGSKEKVESAALALKLKLYPKLKMFSDKLHPTRAGLCEAVIPPSSSLIGQLVGDLHMRREHKIHVVALYRGTSVYQGQELKELTLHSGDTLGMYSSWEVLAEFSENQDFVVVTTSYPHEKTRPEKIPQALIFFGLSLGLALWAHFPISVSLLFGAAGMVATRVLTVDEAYSLVSWKTVFLLAGLIPLGLAMQTTGTVDWLTYHLRFVQESVDPWMLQAGFAVFATLFSLIISNIGATVLLVPIALDVAINIGADPKMYALTVAIASSNTFLIPTHQTNALISAPGGYRVIDFIRVGGIMTIIFWIVMLVALNLVY